MSVAIEVGPLRIVVLASLRIALTGVYAVLITLIRSYLIDVPVLTVAPITPIIVPIAVASVAPVVVSILILPVVIIIVTIAIAPKVPISFAPVIPITLTPVPVALTPVLIVWPPLRLNRRAGH